MSRLPRSLLLSTAVALAAVSADSALAQPAAPPAAPAPPAAAPTPTPAPAAPPSDAAVAKAKEFFDAGAREYEAGHFEDALQLFEQAYRVAPRDGIMFSMAQAHRRQFTASNDPKHLAKAVELYEKYLVAVPTGGRHTEAQQALGELRLLTKGQDLSAVSTAPEPSKPKTRVVVNIFVPGTRVSIDGGPAKPTPLGEDIAPGQHKIKLSAPGYFDVERSITIEEGQIASANLEQKEKPGKLAIAATDGAEVSVDGRFIGEAPLARPLELSSGRHFVSLAKNGHESLALDVDVARDGDKNLAFALKTTSQRDVSYAILGGAGALLVTSGILTGVAVAKQSSASGIEDRVGHETLLPADVTAFEDARSARDRFTAGAIGTGAGGALMGLVGLGLFFFDKPRAVAAPQLDEQKPGQKPGEPSKESPLELSGAPSLGPGQIGGTMQLRF